MQTYPWVVVLIKFSVDFLFLFGGGRLGGEHTGIGRCLLGAAAGAVHSALCLLRGFYFLGNPLWQGAGIVGMALIAYGLEHRLLRCGSVFAILSLALRGIGAGTGTRSAFALLAASAGLGVLCILGFRKGDFRGKYVPVEIWVGDNRLQLKALRDTGNTLRDPITGHPVLIIGANAACQLTGLSHQQLSRPIDTMGEIPGLRLIPYQSVGNENGLMLARKYQNVRIGNWRGSQLVAFAPEGLNGDVEALTGGIA